MKFIVDRNIVLSARFCNSDVKYKYSHSKNAK
jgi:hypothetical protein